MAIIMFEIEPAKLNDLIIPSKLVLSFIYGFYLRKELFGKKELIWLLQIPE
jgi:hypothetical protein